MFLWMQDFDFCINLIKFYQFFFKFYPNFIEIGQIMPKFYPNFDQIGLNFAQTCQKNLPGYASSSYATAFADIIVMPQI